MASRYIGRVEWLASLALLSANGGQAADQWFDPGTGAGISAGTAGWGTSDAAWANTAAGTNNPVPWVDGNNAWFTGPNNTAIVNGATASWVVLPSASGTAKYLFPGSGPLTLTGGLTTYGSLLNPHGGQGSGGWTYFGNDIILDGEQHWHFGNCNVTFTGRLSGATLNKCGYINITVSNAVNDLAGVVIRNGAITTVGGGTPLGTGPVTIGAPVPSNETIANYTLPYLTVNGAGGTTITTTLGDLTIQNNVQLNMNIPSPMGTNELQAGSLVRVGKATFCLNAGYLPHNMKVSFTNLPPMENGILPPWMVECYGAGNQYMTILNGRLTNASYAGSFNPALSNQVVSGNFTLAGPRTAYAYQNYYGSLNLNGYDLTLGDGTMAGLLLANTTINGPGSLDFGTSEAYIGLGNAVSRIQAPIVGSGPLFLFGRNYPLIVSNATAYAGGPITILGPSSLNLYPTENITLSNSISVAPKGGLLKYGPNRLTLAGSTNLVDFAGALSVIGGTLVLDGGLMTNNGYLYVSGIDSSLLMTNNLQPGSASLNFSGTNNLMAMAQGSQFHGAPAINFTGVSNRLEVADGVLGNAIGLANNWIVAGIGNGLRVARSTLSSGNLYVGNSINTGCWAEVEGPGVAWNFNTFQLMIGTGDGPSANHRMEVDGGGTTDGVVFTNVGSLTVGSGGNVGRKSDTILILKNGVTYYGGAITVGAGNNNSMPSNNTLRIGDAGAPCVIRSSSSISMGGGGNSNAVNGGNLIDITNAYVWSKGTSISGPNNDLIVRAGTVWDMAGGADSLGAGGVSNRMVIDGAIVTNVGRILYSANTGSLAVVNGGRIIGTGTGNGNSFGSGTHGGTFLISTNSLLVVVRNLDVGAGTGSGNTLLIDGGAYSNAAAVSFTLGGGRNNSLLLTGTGRMFLSGGGMTVGTSATGSNNTAVVEGDSRLLGVGGLSIGYNTAANNRMLVTTGSVLDVSSVNLGPAAAGLGNTLDVPGGVLQFTIASPSITKGANASITLTDGVLGFRGVNNASVRTHQTTSLTNVTFEGANAFRLCNATNNVAASQSYWYDTGLGATNFAGLEMVDGGTAYTNGSVTIGTNGWLTFSNTTAVMWGAVTNLGAMTVFDSTVTFMSNLVLGEGSTLAWNTNATTNAITVMGDLVLPQSLALSAPDAVGKGETVTLFTVNGTLSGSPAGWSVTPSSYRVSRSGNALVMTRKALGTVIMLQ